MIEVDVAQLARWMNGEVFGDSSVKVLGGAQVDSRLVKAGDVFFALRGQNADGHDFVIPALEKGACCVVVRQVAGPWVRLLRPGQALIKVNDGVEALQKCARSYRALLNIPVIAITGSTGKTSTKDILSAVLGAYLYVMKSPGNFNNEIGLPLTILGVQPEHQALIVEMGMRGEGQIHDLCQIAQPNIGILTNIGPVHMELLGSLDAIARAKGELLRDLPNGGTSIVNGEDPLAVVQAIASGRKTLFYATSLEELERGLQKGGSPTNMPVDAVMASDIEPMGDKGSRVRGQLVSYQPDQGIVKNVQPFEFTIPLPGRHQVANALAALGVVHVLKGDLGTAVQGLANVRLSALRWETYRLYQDITLINDAYNANPAAMNAALTTVADMAEKNRKVAVLGEMYELGDAAVPSHELVGSQAARLGYGLLVAIGPLGTHIAQGARLAGMIEQNILHFDDISAAAEVLPGLLQPGDRVLVKASRGMRLERLVAILTRALS